jgi:hypothetical protein
VQLDPDTPKAARGAGVIVGLQGLVGVVFAVVLLVAPGSLTTQDRLGEAGFFLVMAAIVVGLGVALVFGKRGARSPAVVVELILIGIAGYVTLPSGQYAYGIPIAIVCVYTLYLLLSAGVREWVMDRESSDQDPD